MREGLAACPGWGEATALGPMWILANSAITPHSEQLAHNGYSGTCSPSIGHGDPRSSPLACLSTTWQPEITPPRAAQDAVMPAVPIHSHRSVAMDNTR